MKITKPISRDENNFDDESSQNNPSVFNSNTEVSLNTVSNSCTDLGNVDRFIKLYGDVVLYCYEKKVWFIWNGKRWEEDKKGKIDLFAQKTAQEISYESRRARSPNTAVQLTKWATQSLSENRIRAMKKLVMSHVSVGVDELDQHPMLVNVGNGVIDLNTGELLPHDRKYRMTYIIDIDYEKADCPKWKAFLDTIIPDEELQAYLQKLAGYSLTGVTSEQILIFLFGTGANGKSTFIETLRYIFGDYAQGTNIEALLRKKYVGGNTPYIARMRGARLVTASEIPNGRRLNESMIKDLTGGDKVVASAKYQHPIEFQPTHKLWIVGNHKPQVQDTSHGFWRRIRVIPFEKTIPEEKQIPINTMLENFKSEASGILHWVVEGCVKWQKEGLKSIELVKDATKEYRTDIDIFQLFIEEKTEIQPEHEEKKDDIYREFKLWVRNSGETELAKKGKTWITRELKKRGFKDGGKNKSKIYGIKVKNNAMTDDYWDDVDWSDDENW